jgi:peptidyl-prolyl cis-trans isomerase B (cyclophilin B)
LIDGLLLGGYMTSKNGVWLLNLVSLILIGSLVLGGCSTSANNTSQSDTSNVQSQPEAIAVNTNKQMDNNLPQLKGMATVEVTIEGKSPIVIELNGTEAPITAGNFVDLVDRGVYDGLVFHRVIPGFVAQGGDPQGKDPNFGGQLGTGGFIDPETGAERRIPLEIKLDGEGEPSYSKAKLPGSSVVLKHDRGVIAMARSMMPDSASSQFYIALEDLPSLDGDYAVFGRVTQGMDVVDGIKQGDRIATAKVTQGIENLQK